MLCDSRIVLLPGKQRTRYCITYSPVLCYISWLLFLHLFHIQRNDFVLKTIL